MEFSTQTTASLHQIKTAALAVGVFADGVLSPAADLIDRAANGAVRAVTKTEFRGRAGSTLVLRALPGVAAQRVVLVGLGKQDEYSARAHASAEQAFAAACVSAQLTEGVSTLAANPIADVAIIARARSAAIAAGSATYHYDASFGKPDRDARPKLKKIVQIVERADAAQAQKGLREGAAIANGMELTRTLGNLPGNLCTPTYLGETAKRLAREYKSLKVEVMDRKQVEALGMGSFLSVARGSEEALRFIVLRHAGKPAKKGAKASDGPIVLVGKGITFDAGGISLKPAATMDEMKYDMCGAASVLGSFRALAELELPLDVIGLIPACENLPSGKANKPGDVVTSMAGLTIEILNTDAEGRLVLCDALTYAERFKPSAVIDIATLTGACVWPWATSTPACSARTTRWPRHSRRPAARPWTPPGACRWTMPTRTSSSPTSPTWPTSAAPRPAPSRPPASCRASPSRTAGPTWTSPVRPGRAARTRAPRAVPCRC